MKLLLSCDQVFDVLTRGPFPTGHRSDEAVEHHLAACHECRQLAEALRPAVALIHEAVSQEESLELPEYQGALPEPDPSEYDISPFDWKLPARAPAARGPALTAQRPTTLQPRAGRTTLFLNAARLIAASVLVVTLGWLAWGLTLSPTYPATSSASGGWNGERGRVSAASLDEAGFVKLASLKLPRRCLPAELTADASSVLRCCTECHRAGGATAHVANLAAFNAACSACHRG